MRIARVLTRLNLGGPARQVLASDPLLVQRGHEVRVFAGYPEPGEGDLFEQLSGQGVDVVRVRGLSRRPGLADLVASGSLRRALAGFRPDLVHTHASKAGLLGRRAAWRIPGVKTVHTFHGHVLEGYFPRFVSRGLVRLEASLASRTDRILAVSAATAGDLSRLGVVPLGRLTVVHPGVNLDPLLAVEGHSGRLRAALGLSPADVLIGVVGRLAEVKRPELAVQVFESLAGDHPRAHLCFVGDGSERGPLEARIRDMPEDLRRRVHLVGAQPNMVDVMADLDVVLSTSRSEGLPVALIEAAAAAVPVVATAVGGVCELVEHEATGLLGKSLPEIGDGLSRLLMDPGWRKELGGQARSRVSEPFGACALADRLEAVYGQTLEAAPCA